MSTISLPDASEHLMAWVRRDRKSRGLPTEHCLPNEMLFPGVPEKILGTFSSAKDNPAHRGYAAHCRGDLNAAQEAWAPLREKCARDRYVLANVNLDPAFYAGLTDYSGWPMVHGVKGPPGKTVFISCDGKYFDKFGAALIVSLREKTSLQIHLHLMDPNKAQLDAAIGMGTEGMTYELPEADRGYYHAVRFVRFREFLDHYGEILLLDADQLANLDPAPLFTAEPFGVRFRPGRIEPWNQMNASAVYGRAPESLEYFTKVAAYITAYRMQMFWGIDQLALYAVWAMGCRPSVHAYMPKDLDYDYTTEGIIWPNSGAGKFTGSTERPAFMARFEQCQANTPTPEGLSMQAQRLVRDGNHAQAIPVLTMCMEAVADRATFREIEFPKAPDRKVGKFIYLPVEIYARELPSKAWLAGEMARRGYQVLLGATWEMGAQEFRDFPPGLILFKTLNALDAVNIAFAQEAGHLTAALNEEFFGLRPERWLYETETHPSALQNIDLICAQGAAAKNCFETFAPGRTFLTGNARGIQVYSHPRGREILIPTMSGTINNLLPFHEYMEASFRTYGRAGPDQQKIIREQIEHETTHLPMMLEAISEIALSKPDRTIRVRPHPSEDRSPYATIGTLHPNVILDDRTPFSERLKDAAIVVFVSGCGTGLEAALAGVPAIRVGEGGHGISADLGAPYSPGIVKFFLETNVVGQSYGLSKDFAPVTLPSVLDEFASARQMNLKVNLAIVAACREGQFKPHPFHENKFPDVSDDRIAELTGASVKRVGWRMWVVHA